MLSRKIAYEFPGVRGFGFIQQVERSALNTFVAQEKADGAPDFAIHDLGYRNYPDLFVVKFIEPAAGNEGAQGLDVGSEALRRAAIQQAITTGAETVTGHIALVQDNNKLPALLLFVPIYRNGAPVDLPRERRAALLGVLYAPIVVSEILNAIPDVQSGMLDFRITDAPINSSGGTVMFDTASLTQAPDTGRALPRYTLRRPLQLPGRSVTLTSSSSSSSPAFEASVSHTAPWLLLGGGMLVSALLAFTMYQLASGRLRAQELVEERTRDLRSALRDNDALFSTLNLHSIVSIADRGGRIIEANDLFCQISGYSRNELIGQDHRIVNSHVQPSSFWEGIWKTIASGQAWRGQVCNISKDGRLYWVDTVIAPIAGEDGNIEKYISIRTDITAIKEAEEELRWRQSLLDKMSNSSPLAFLVVDNRSDEILYINHRCIEIWGLEHLAERIRRGEMGFGEFTRAGLPMLVDSVAYLESCKPLQLQINRSTLEDEIAFTGERTVRRYSTQIRDADDNYYGRFYIFEDITARKVAERSLTDATEAAQAASLSKSQFLANMSHEIRTPMNAILGLLNLVQSTELTAQQRDYASKTEGAAQSLLGLLNDILDFSKVEAGKMTLESEPFRIDRLLRNLSVVLSANVGAKSLDILFDVDPALPPVLRGDAMRLQQVLINLGGNAVKFTSEGQVVLSLRLLGQTTEAATIEFAVKDTGIGIAPEHQDRIFSGFSQAEGSTTRRFGGAGLGLAISKRFVELMGGAMQLRSAPGVGSTFSFVLELPTVSEVPQDLRESAPQAMEPQRVLVVDDNPLAGELTLAMVQSWGWSAELASSGKQAVELVEAQCKQGGSQFPYPVIYTDWRLPDIDGWETSRRIRQLARTHGLPQPTIIMVTAQGREMLAQRPEGDQDLLNGFMVKPVTAPMMYDALLDAVSGKSGLRKMTKGRSNARQLSGMRILVVEDNLINQQVADELLSAAGAIVSLATNGQIGVEAVAAAAPQFDVVLMDVQMPVLDGYGATRAIREELGMKTLPIIAMTANAMASDREVCLAAGMSEHIGKPFEMAKLVSMLLRMTGFQVQEAVALDALPEGAAAATELPEIAGLELATAVARMAGMRALYLRTARDFLRILDGTVTELRDGLAKGNRALLAMRLHTLKGNAATLGAMAMAGRAAAMETLCKTDAGMQACVQEMDSFEALVASTRQLLQQAIAALGGNIAVTADASPAQANVAAQAVLQQLTALTAADDLQALAYFAEQRSMLSNLPGDWLDRMDQALQDLDLASAHALAQDMLQQAAVP